MRQATSSTYKLSFSDSVRGGSCLFSKVIRDLEKGQRIYAGWLAQLAGGDGRRRRFRRSRSGERIVGAGHSARHVKDAPPPYHQAAETRMARHVSGVGKSRALLGGNNPPVSKPPNPRAGPTFYSSIS
ncbi:hypothetical protein CRG98_002501 [Punica granatum]|uniref:Uncharacterized protein n=1 Tax=Punica granatum TaxID=22663 RepID=A0A2I0L8H3_PUNGR|nr:hypothetical protein CRG98_002501 [Punica granatum]